MNDSPTPAELLAAVSRFMRDEVMPALTGATAYQARVAANMLDIASRQWAMAPAQDAEELQQLRTLLGREVGLAEGNRLLCEHITAGTLTLATSGLADHLWQTTLAKLAVDQPSYDTYRRLIHTPKVTPKVTPKDSPKVTPIAKES